MTKKTGTIITIVVAALALCCFTVFCASSIITAASGRQYVDALEIYVEPWWGLFPCCLSILVLVVPLLSWLFLVRGKQDGARGIGIEEEFEGTIEDDFSYE